MYYILVYFALRFCCALLHLESARWRINRISCSYFFLNSSSKSQREAVIRCTSLPSAAPLLYRFPSRRCCLESLRSLWEGKSCSIVVSRHYRHLQSAYGSCPLDTQLEYSLYLAVWFVYFLINDSKYEYALVYFAYCQYSDQLASHASEFLSIRVY